MEREYHRHPAGLRTMGMVSVGSCLFTVLGAYVGADHTDPTRIAAQVVSGIGFLGAGAILRLGIGIKGLTTAATIWVVAAIGMSVGFGYYVISLSCTVMVLIALFAIRPLEARLFGKTPLQPSEEEKDY
jgi:putative Mg2+ transporter-C (MgtC) family protein